MPTPGKQLDREIAEALQGRRLTKALQGRLPTKQSGKRATKTTKTTKTPVVRTRAKSKKIAAHAKKKSARTKQTDRQQIEELIHSADPEDWNVARDLALQQNIRDMIVRLDMSRALDAAPHELEVIEGQPYDESFEARLGRNQHYVVVPDEDTAYKIAIERVKDDLAGEPNLFSSKFLAQHIDQKKLKKWVYDVSMDDDYVDELAANQVDDFWDLARRLDVDGVVPDTDEEGDQIEPTRKQINAVKEAYAEDRSRAPMEFFDDMYGDAAIDQAIKAVGIDTQAAAEEAVDTDGWQHFLAGYDGNSDTTDSGLVYWRV